MAGNKDPKVRETAEYHLEKMLAYETYVGGWNYYDFEAGTQGWTTTGVPTWLRAAPGHGTGAGEAPGGSSFAVAGDLGYVDAMDASLVSPREVFRVAVVEGAAAVILAVTAVATSWAGFQAVRWGGVQSERFSEAGLQRAERAHLEPGLQFRQDEGRNDDLHGQVVDVVGADVLHLHELDARDVGDPRGATQHLQRAAPARRPRTLNTAFPGPNGKSSNAPGSWRHRLRTAS